MPTLWTNRLPRYLGVSVLHLGLLGQTPCTKHKREQTISSPNGTTLPYPYDTLSLPYPTLSLPYPIPYHIPTIPYPTRTPPNPKSTPSYPTLFYPYPTLPLHYSTPTILTLPYFTPTIPFPYPTLPQHYKTLPLPYPTLLTWQAFLLKGNFILAYSRHCMYLFKVVEQYGLPISTMYVHKQFIRRRFIY